MYTSGKETGFQTILRTFLTNFPMVFHLYYTFYCEFQSNFSSPTEYLGNSCSKLFLISAAGSRHLTDAAELRIGILKCKSCQTDVPTQLTKFSKFPYITEGNFKNRMRKFSVVKLQRGPRDPR